VLPNGAHVSHGATVVFRSNRQSRVTHPPINIEIWQGSRVTQPFVEPPKRHTELKIACKTPKSQNFRFDVENFMVSRQILAAVEMSNWFFGSRITPSGDLNEILQYSWRPLISGKAGNDVLKKVENKLKVIVGTRLACVLTDRRTDDSANT
jgi:hypothetical protein